MNELWTLTWEAGPDAGGRAVVGPGTHLVGKAQGAAVRCDDAALEPHHALIEVLPDRAELRQLTGRIPVRVDGGAVAGPTVLGSGARVEVGHSVLSVHRGDLTAPGHGAEPANITTTRQGKVVVRRPRSAPVWEPDPVSPSVSRSTAGTGGGGVVPALVAFAGSGLLAALLHQPMFLVFGAIGAMVAIGTWGGQRCSLIRRRRRDAAEAVADIERFEREVDDQRRAFVGHHLAVDSTAVSARQAIEMRTDELWARRAAHPDAFAVSIGSGSVVWSPRLEADLHAGLNTTAVLPDLPVIADLGPGARLALRGNLDRTVAVVRAILVQLAANCGPADVRFVVVTHESARWRWLEMLPHATTASGLAAVVAEADLLETVAEFDAAAHLHLVVITDSAELLAARTSPLRRVVTTERSVALVVSVEEGGGVPHVCSSLLDLGGPMRARWHADAALASLPVEVRCAGISERSGRRLVLALAGLVDPEDPLVAGGTIPRDVSILSLLPSCEPAAIAAAWVANGSDPAPRTVIGVAADGVVDVDLVRDGPHALVAGTTGAGKSELLRSMVAGLAAASSPDHLTFVLIDYKGGSTFDACARLPHVVGVVTDLDDHLAARALRCLRAELRRREQLLRGAGAADLPAYRRLAPHEVLPRLVVVIDEFAALVTEQPAFLHSLVGIAQRGRSLGVHLILATQRPNGVVSDDIRANTNLRLALRLHDAAEAVDIVGDRAPAAIPRGMPGRAVMRLGPDEMLSFQTAHCTSGSSSSGSELDGLVDAVIAAAGLVGSRPPRSPWPPPLPAVLPLDRDAVAHGIVGSVDDPDAQRTVPLRWHRGDGNLLMVGAAGSGLTSALTLLGMSALSDGSGSHVYVIDGRGDPALAALSRSPSCAAVVGVHEQERLMRVVNRLGAEVERRMIDPQSGGTPTVVLIDGLDSIRNALDDLDTAAESEMLDTVLAFGSAHGVVVVGTTDRAGAIPSMMLARFPQRWAFHLTDPIDAVSLGVAAADVPGPRPGRVIVAASGLEAQLMFGEVVVPACIDGAVPPPVECLPASIDAADLPRGIGTGEGTLLPIGVRFGDGRACTVDVPDGEHLLIVGPPRSGRSTAMLRLVQAWRQAHRDGWWRVVAPRRSVFDEHRHRSLAEIIGDVPGDGKVLIAIDDAELVDDVGGALAALAATRRHGLTIVAAGKPDSLRQSYGHWTGVVRRSRLGVVMTASSDLDGDLLGAMLPRRTPIPPRPGLVWLVSDGQVTLAQLAVDDPVVLPTIPQWETAV